MTQESLAYDAALSDAPASIAVTAARKYVVYPDCLFLL